MEPLDEVQVYYGDLESVHSTLSSIYNYLLAQDLVDQYRKLSNRTTEGKLTANVKAARDRVYGLLQEAEADTEEASDEATA